MKKIVYLCLQATIQGQASHAHVHEIINGLREFGWEIKLFEPYYAKKNRNPTVFERVWAFLLVQIQLILNKENPDLIYIRNHFAALPVAIWAKVKRITVIVEINGPYEDLFISWPTTKYFSSFFKYIIRYQYKIADALITVTPQLKDWVKKEIQCEKKIEVIPNGANNDLFRPNVTPINIPEFNSSTYVIFFGAFSRWQGIDCILKAVEKVTWPKDIDLVLVGDGPEREYIEKIANKNPRVFFLGKIPYKEMPGIIAPALASLIPKNNLGGYSKTGLFPLKLFEALSCGVPVIVTDLPGMADIVRKNETGLIIPIDDPDALINAIKYLSKNNHERKKMGEKGREVIEEKYSWKIASEKTSDFLNAIISENC